MDEGEVVVMDMMGWGCVIGMGIEGGAIPWCARSHGSYNHGIKSPIDKVANVGGANGIPIAVRDINGVF
jgi:hypothetical protein